MILSQICETMTGMSRPSWLLPWLGAAAFLALAGCCGGGSTHRCDFSPPTNPPDASANSDAGIPCPDQPCTGGTACCLTKAPLAARCVPITEYMADNCEMINRNPPPCWSTSDCTTPDTVCCYQVALTLISCQPSAVCSGDGTDTYLVCGSDLDCPPTAASCSLVTTNPDTGAPLGFCSR